MVWKTNRESGQALIAVAFGLVVMLAAAGLAVDMGYLRYERRLQQSAADSAALAGAAAAGSGGSVTFAAKQDAQLNGFQDGVNNTTVTVTQINFNGQPNAVRVVVTAVHPTFFMKIFGAALGTASVSTTAVAQYTANRNCIYALRGGNGINIGSNVNIPNCGVLDAQNMSGGGHLTASSIGVSGTNGLATTPTAITGIVQTTDPFANLAAPGTGGGCTNILVNVANYGNNDVNLGAGHYCGISIAAAFTHNVNFGNGTYRITGPGGLSFQGSGHVTGNSVTFYLTNGAINFSNSQRIRLSAPTNGTYSGILFFQRATNGAAATLTGSGGSFFEGALYFPGAQLTLNGGGTGANYMIMVAKTIHINTNVSFNSNYGALANGSPIKAATLVQ